MSSIENEWFREMNDQWAGLSVGLKIEKVLYEGKSKYQDILVFKSTTFGNVLVLDGCIQCTERDECCYQEMIAHLPMNCHDNPVHVLVVGGGDGGVVREVLKYKSVMRVTLCEIDEAVIDVCKKHLPNMSQSLNDPRVLVHIGDGVQYMKEHKNCYDVIITDAPDPIGAAKGLFELDYYKCLKAALKPNGIICSQGQNLWLELPLIKQMLAACRELFPTSGYAFSSMPTYVGGHIGFLLASINPDLNLCQPLRTLSDEDLEEMELKFYNSETHRAAFVLPQFAKKVLQQSTSSRNATNHNGDT